MKHSLRIALIALICLLGMSPLYAQHRSGKAASNHSVSLTTLYGIEYSYEHRWNSGMSLIGRVGGGSEVYACSDVYTLGKGFTATLEPRYYVNEEDFFSMKLNGAVLIPGTTLDLSLVPIYGIKRDYTEHWFCEFTIGGGVAYYSGNGGSLYFKPHLQFRIGFRF